MNHQEQHRRFEADVDALLDGCVGSAEPVGAHSDLLAIGRTLAAADFGAADHKGAVKRRIAQRNAAAGALRGRVGWKFAGIAAIAAASAIVVGVAFTQPTFASTMLSRIISTISLGHITAIQVEPPSENLSYPIPKDMRGQIFTKEGKPVDEVTAQTGPLYTADGQEIYDFTNGRIVTKAEAEAQEKEGVRILTDPDTLSAHTSFKVKWPDYLPEGYTFNRAEQFVDEQGEVSPKYIKLYFSKGDTGKEIKVMEAYADEEAAYIWSTDGTIEQAKVNGTDAVIINEHTLDWEADGLYLTVHTKGMGEKIEKSELIRIAESLK
ncbi:DUF4367 domain-containing protein [Paenibacillus phocaensis]|uniref:DUF4367 domain-containing protein n=1 Tax=Paenibacillus phocaensis TaxID=1776378 RepID=UPI000839B3BB|nr:DUF4367 domain-containing protein [Paenibacillus phocaensis]